MTLGSNYSLGTSWSKMFTCKHFCIELDIRNMCVRVRACVCVVHTRLGMPLLLHPSLNHLSAGPDVVVCDEGHVLRNCKSALSQAVNKVATQRRIVLTGTPLQNNLQECAWGQALSSLKWGSLSYTENMCHTANCIHVCCVCSIQMR